MVFVGRGYSKPSAPAYTAPWISPQTAPLLPSSAMFSTLRVLNMEPSAPHPSKTAKEGKPEAPGSDPKPPVVVPPRYGQKSKLGCLTCKARKKKCDETRPVCKDCLRFKKECVWADHTMSRPEIRKLRDQVNAQVNQTKMRSRRLVKKAAAEKKTAPAERVYADSASGPHTPHITAPKPPRQSPPLDPLTIAQTDPLKQERVPAHHLEPLPVSPPSAYYATGYSEDQMPLLKFLKDLNLYHHDRDHIDELPDDDVEGAHPMHIEPLDEENCVALPLAVSPNFNVPHFMENIHLLKQGSPRSLNDLAFSFNAVFSPRPQVHLSFLPDLDESGQFLYNYYVNTLAPKVCIAPTSQDESNSYQKVFLPLAQKDNGVLYGILAWAGFHLGGKWLLEGSKYAELAVKLLTKDVDFLNNSHIENDRRSILNKLATILILCGAEICRGDVKYWSVYLNWGWKLLKDNGGILNFDNNKEEHWLISNFAYHDLMASSTLERGTYFPLDTYDTIFADAEGVSRGLLDPLLGVSKGLFKVIGDINSLAYESKITLEEYYNRTHERFSHDLGANVSAKNVAQSPDGPMTSFTSGSETSEHGQNSRLLFSILHQAQKLQRTIDSAKPKMTDLMDMSDADLELQLTCFEAFQLSCSLYLRQSIMKCNPSTLESQIIVNDLVKCLDILLDSPMEATLVFPIFMAGIHLVTEADRDAMRSRMEKMIATYGPWNVVRVKYLVERVWEENPDGDRVVDWHAILKTLDWDLNFA